MSELVLLVPEECAEIVSDALESLDALSISFTDADAQTPQEQALFGEPGMVVDKTNWQRSTVTALFENEETAQTALKLLQVQDFFAPCECVSIHAVANQDWVRLTQSQFAPIPITPSFWIVPSWHEAPDQATHFLQLDPGLAFGTGTHPTTRMCLRWIAKHPPHQERVLDYGCGSGILAMTAKIFGAATVDAVDIDANAVESAQLNAQNNRLQLNTGLPDLAHGTYHLVLANILASPLKVLAPLLCQHLAPNGQLVLAGILSRQAEELQEAYQAYLKLQIEDEEDGWILMTARLNA